MRRLILLLALLGCAEPDLTVIDPAFNKYIDLFVAAGAEHCRHINPVGFDIKFQKGVLIEYGGVAATIKNNKKQDRILFDAEYFEANPEALEWVFFHEGGHAWLNREHVAQWSSIMNPNTYPRDLSDSTRRAGLLRELFGDYCN